MDIYKAQRIGEMRQVPDLNIAATVEIPRMPTLDEQREIHYMNAMTIEQALFDSLPGGTYDQLAALMLQRVASNLVVPLPDHGRK